MTYEGILMIAGEHYKAHPDKEWVKEQLRYKMWKPDEEQMERALNAIESDKDLSLKEGKVVTVNGKKGRWIMDDFNRLLFINAKGEEIV